MKSVIKNPAFSVCIALVQILSFTQVSAQDDDSGLRLDKADSLFSVRQYQLAQEAYQAHMNYFEEAKQWENLVYVYERLSATFRAQYKDSLASVNYLKGLTIAKAHLPENDLLLSRLYLGEAIRNNIQFNTNKAVAYIDSAMSTYKRSTKKDSLLHLEIIDKKYASNFYGDLMAHRDTCIKYLHIRRNLYKKAEVIDTDLWFHLMEDYAALYRKFGDYNQAINYALEGLSLAESKINSSNEDNLVRLKVELAAALYLSGQYAQGLAVSKQILSNYLQGVESNRAGVCDFYSLISLNYEGLEQFDSALYFSEKAIQSLETEMVEMEGEMAVTLRAYWSYVSNKGIIYEKMQDYENAEKYYLKGLAGGKRDLANNPLGVIEKYRFVASYYAQMNKPFKAIAYADSTLSYSNNFQGFTAELIDDKETLFALGTKIVQDVDAYLISQDTSWLHLALKETDIMIEAIDYLRTEYLGTDNKLELASATKPFLEASIFSSYELYKLTNDEKYVETALKNMSRSKALHFLDELGEYELVSSNEVTEVERIDYAVAKKNVERLEAKLSELIENNIEDDSISVFFTEKLIWNKRLSGIKSQIQRKALSGVSKIADTWSIDQYRDSLDISGDRMFVEYFAGDDYIFATMVDHDSVALFRINRDDTSEQSMTQLISLLSEKDSYPPTVSDKAGYYGKIAHEVYQYLLAPVLGITSGQHSSLIIVPDDHLGQIPFELLVSTEPAKNTDFSSLDYLLKDFNVSYSFSTRASAKTANRNKGTILGIAYSDKDLVDERRSLGGLPGAVEEIKYLKANFVGDFFTGIKGTKQTFLNEARKHNILHLAIHGSADTTRHQEPVLIFNGDHDFELTTQDLFQTKINAQMAVLSACQTGVGRLRKGEGIFSMARGFATAGVPSIVTSLWNVNDKAGATITQSFYQYLDQGYTKDKALRAAKLDYLEQSNPVNANPYYWGGYIHIGDKSSIELRSATAVKWYWIVILALCTAIVFLFRKKQVAGKLKESVSNYA